MKDGSSSSLQYDPHKQASSVFSFSFFFFPISHITEITGSEKIKYETKKQKNKTDLYQSLV